MNLLRTLLGVAAAAAVLGVAGCGAMHGHGMHHGHAASCPMSTDMQQKMAAAKTPEERQALMAEHRQHMGMGGMGMGGDMQCPMMGAPGAPAPAK